MTVRGKFITLEGGEGAGKSTSLAAIKDYLGAQNIDAVFTREPGGTAVGEEIRLLLLSPENAGLISSETELLLMFAARAEHLRAVILPALDAGKWVVSDRFTDASYAYQGGGRSMDIGRIKSLEAWLQQGFEPDLTLYLDISVEQGLARAAQRGEKDRFEREQFSFFERVRDMYRLRAKENPHRFRIIDASQAQQQVQSSIIEHLSKLINDD